MSDKVQGDIKRISIVTNENSSVASGEQDAKYMNITFSFNMDDYEVVRTKDKAWLIREKK